MDLKQNGLPVSVASFKSHCELRFDVDSSDSEFSLLLEPLKNIVLLITVVNNELWVYISLSNEIGLNRGHNAIEGYDRDVARLFEELEFYNIANIKKIKTIH